MKIDWTKVKEGFTITDVLKEENKELKQEIERLKEDNEYLNKVNIELSTEKNRLNNIINELEKALNENVELTYVHNGKRQYNKSLTEGGLLFRDYIKSKLQELKGVDKE